LNALSTLGTSYLKKPQLESLGQLLLRIGLTEEVSSLRTSNFGIDQSFPPFCTISRSRSNRVKKWELSEGKLLLLPWDRHELFKLYTIGN
jgi:hypothetical protein